MKSLLFAFTALLFASKSHGQYSNLYQDQDFIDIIQIDNQIHALNSLDSSQSQRFLESEEVYNLALENIQNATTASQGIETFTHAGIPNASAMFDLFTQKATKLLSLHDKYPALYKLSYADFKQVWQTNLAQATGTAPRHPGCINDCCDDYVDAVDDCDTDFIIGTAFSCLAAAGAGVATAGVGAAGALSVGVGATYMYHTRCMNTAVRTYKLCVSRLQGH